MIKRRRTGHVNPVKATQIAQMNAAIDAAGDTTKTDSQVVRRYNYILAQYARKHHTEMDGTSQWFFNSPYLGGAGQAYATIEEALDAEMDARVVHDEPEDL
jgi:hypothetical protein